MCAGLVLRSFFKFSIYRTARILSRNCDLYPDPNNFAYEAGYKLTSGILAAGNGLCKMNDFVLQLRTIFLADFAGISLWGKHLAAKARSSRMGITTIDPHIFLIFWLVLF